MDSGCYTVPSEVLFRNWSTVQGAQTRNLLLKNTTPRPCRVVLSWPFSPTFHVYAPADQRAELKSTPQHLVLQLQPNSTSKVVVELKPPTSPQTGSQSHLQDVLVVLFGGVCSLLVPVRAVHHGMDAVAPGGAAISGLPFWPTTKELESQWRVFMNAVRPLYDMADQPDPALAPAGVISSAPPSAPPTAPAGAHHPPLRGAPGSGPGPAGAGSGSAGGPTQNGGSAAAATAAAAASVAAASAAAASAAAASAAAAASGALAGALAGPLQVLQQQQRQAAAAPTAAKPAAPPAPHPDLPPDGFSQAAEVSYGGDLLPDDDEFVQQPYVITKTFVKAQGRAAAAVTTAALPPEAAASGAAARGSAGSALGFTPLGLPSGEPLSRTSSGSSGVGAGLNAVSSSYGTNSMGGGGGAAAGPRPGSASSNVAFVLNGRLYDARGQEVDPASKEALTAGPLTVVDCADVSTPRLSRSGSMSGNTPPRLAAPPGASAAAAAASSTPGRVALAPLKHGGVPVAASLRPGSASGPPPSSMAAPPGRHGGGGGGGGGGDDALRAAALAAAMRELGLTDLPAPSPSGRSGPSQPSEWSRGAPGGGMPPPAPAPTAPPAGTSYSYHQYGLPPNYRPSSGRRQPPTATVGAAKRPSGSGHVGDEDEDVHDDADFEARLQQQVESNVLKGSATSGGAGPAPLASSRAGGGGSGPGAYLPPRAGAATSGGLGAASPAAANAAAVAAGSRLGKAAARAAGGAGASSSSRNPSTSNDKDYPEEDDFEVTLQRQIDAANAAGGGGGGGTGSAGSKPAARAGPAGSGSGGGAGWRGSSGGTRTAGAGASGAGAKPGATGAGPALLRSNSHSAGSGAAGVLGARRTSADAAGHDAGKATTAAPRAGSVPRMPLSGAAGAGKAPAPSAGAPPRAAPGRAPPAGRSPAGAAAGAPAPGAKLQKMKANWDALG